MQSSTMNTIVSRLTPSICLHIICSKTFKPFCFIITVYMRSQAYTQLQPLLYTEVCKLQADFVSDNDYKSKTAI